MNQFVVQSREEEEDTWQCRDTCYGKLTSSSESSCGALAEGEVSPLGGFAVAASRAQESESVPCAESDAVFLIESIIDIGKHWYLSQELRSRGGQS